jgi:hypothetical protein
MNHDFERPWQERRGIENIDWNKGLILARTDVESLSTDVASRATSRQRDVLGKRVKVARDYGWVFRLEGHPWSIFLYDGYSVLGAACEISKRLSAPVITYECSDTVGALSYVYAEGGEIRERLSLFDGEIEFSSELRELSVSPSHAYDVADGFFRDRDAYEPGIYAEYFFADGRSVPSLEPGAKRLVGNPGFILCCDGREIRSVPAFERVDYFVFGPE